MSKRIARYRSQADTDMDGNPVSEHLRSFLHDTITDTIYLPALEDHALMVISEGKTNLIENDLGVFIPVSWFIDKYPQHDYASIETKMRTNIKGD